MPHSQANPSPSRSRPFGSCAGPPASRKARCASSLEAKSSQFRSPPPAPLRSYCRTPRRAAELEPAEPRLTRRDSLSVAAGRDSCGGEAACVGGAALGGGAAGARSTRNAVSVLRRSTG